MKKNNMTLIMRKNVEQDPELVSKKPINGRTAFTNTAFNIEIG
jgi:hypothetical protein